jgi:lipid II:glycine glycyltransferase (peptidoglycan interpeptide bridge formation enzyme)
VNYKINTSLNKVEWESSIHKFPEANFLQSWNWGHFQENIGRRVTRIALFDDSENGYLQSTSNFDDLTNKSDNVLAMAQLVLEPAKRGAYIAVAGGPLMDWHNDLLAEKLFEVIKQVARQQGAVFIRFRPQEENSIELRQKVLKLGARLAQMHLTADLTLQLDLTMSEDDLLAQMRKNTRSSIRKAEREGITVEISNDPGDIKEFYQHQLFLAEKHGFVPFSYEYLDEQFRAFVVDDQALLFHAYKNNKLLASSFNIFYNKEAVYHYGISTPDNLKLPGSYACQWEAIKEAKKRECKKYNFWGIAPADAVDHRFAGVTLFKTGFGGEQVEYLHAHDLPLGWQYNFVNLFEFFRKKIRRL